MELGTSLEEYLETIYILEIIKGKKVRNVDLVETLNVKKPSVSRAVKKLENEGYITKGLNYELILTEKGKDLGGRIYQRYVFWRRLLKKAGVDKESAEVEALDMRHVLTDKSFRKLKKIYK